MRSSGSDREDCRPPGPVDLLQTRAGTQEQPLMAGGPGALLGLRACDSFGERLGQSEASEEAARPSTSLRVRSAEGVGLVEMLLVRNERGAPNSGSVFVDFNPLPGWHRGTDTGTPGLRAPSDLSSDRGHQGVGFESVSVLPKAQLSQRDSQLPKLHTGSPGDTARLCRPGFSF